MRCEDVLTALRPLKAELTTLGFRKLYLFGSAARSAPDANDVDLLFEAQPDNDPGYFGIWRVQDRLAALLGKPVDLVDRKGLHERIRARVEAEMIEIY